MTFTRKQTPWINYLLNATSKSSQNEKSIRHVMADSFNIPYWLIVKSH